MAKVKTNADELSAPNSKKIFSNNPITLSESKPLADMDGTDVVTKDNLTSVISNNYEVPFEDVATYEIEWQTDLIDGVNTFADVLGNTLPKCFVYTVDPEDADGFIITGTTPKPKRIAGIITTVNFDFGGISSTGIIVF